MAFMVPLEGKGRFLAGSTNKKVLIRRFDREQLSGFVNPLTYLTEKGVELLNLHGSVAVIPYSDIKSVHFVREFEPTRQVEQQAFLTRPKLDGLWVRMRFRDEDLLEGVLPNNLLQLEHFGFTVTPPDYTYNNQRLFVPKAALKEIQVLGVVGSPLRLPRRKSKEKPPQDQIKLFE
jgi:hypothetical protein